MTRRTLSKESKKESAFKQQVSRILDAISFSQSYSFPAMWRPPTDIYETDNAVIVKIEVAGVNPDDFNISFADHVLTIQGTRIDTEAKLNYHCLEIPYGEFQVRILVRGLYDVDHISANYKNGYLYVILPKSE